MQQVFSNDPTNVQECGADHIHCIATTKKKCAKKLNLLEILMLLYILGAG
jgi:hypothetical protein